MSEFRIHLHRFLWQKHIETTRLSIYFVFPTIWHCLQYNKHTDTSYNYPGFKSPKKGIEIPSTKCANCDHIPTGIFWSYPNLLIVLLFHHSKSFVPFHVLMAAFNCERQFLRPNSLIFLVNHFPLLHYLGTSNQALQFSHLRTYKSFFFFFFNSTDEVTNPLIYLGAAQRLK